MLSDLLADLPLLVAHEGAGASWQALLAVLGIGLAIVAVLAALDRVPIASGDDLVLPLAGVAIISSAAPVFSDVLSDMIGYVIPIGIAALLLLLLYAFVLRERPQRIQAASLLGIGVVVSVAFGATINRNVHPLDQVLLIPDDLEIAITAPTPDDAGDIVVEGPFTVQVAITGGNVGPQDVEIVEDDFETYGTIAFFVDGRRVQDAVYDQTCTRENPCTNISTTLDIAPGQHVIHAEFKPSGGRGLAFPVFSAIAVTVE